MMVPPKSTFRARGARGPLRFVLSLNPDARISSPAARQSWLLTSYMSGTTSVSSGGIQGFLEDERLRAL